MTNHDLNQRLEQLAERLARIERHLGLHQQPSSTRILPEVSEQIQCSSADDEALHAAQQVVKPPAVQAPQAPPVVITSPPISSRSEAFTRLRSEWEQQQREAPPTVASPPPPTVAHPPIAPPVAAPIASVAPQPIHDGSSEFVPDGIDDTSEQPRVTDTVRAPLEMLIGGKWMAWVGAIVVVLAAGFAVKVGIDMGWWGRVSPTVRCLIIAAFGGSLLVCGELALRRFGRAASVGLFGAGLGTLYLDAFATARFFHIVSSEVSFLLMGVVALGGFFITLRTRFLTIGVLSLLGGYLAPLLIGGQSSLDLEMLTYLTALLGIALGLSAVMPQPFRTLRYLALGGQGIVGLGWLVANASSQWIMAIVFLSIWWTMVLGECVWAALRRQSAIGNVVATVLATAAYVTAGCWVLGSAAVATNASEWLGAFTAMIAALCMAAALQFGPGLDGLRGRLRTAMDQLAVALWCQAGVLLAAAVALQFDGFGQSVAWLALGLAAIEIGRRLPSRGVAVFGLAVGALAFTRVTLFDWWITRGFATTFWEFGDVRLSHWAILAMATIVITHVAAHRLRDESPASWRIMPVVLAGAATVLWLALCATHCLDLAMTSAWLLGAAALFALERFGRRQRYFEIGLMVLLFAVGKWLLVDGLMARRAPAWSETDRVFILNWQMGVAVAIAVVGWWAYRILLRRERDLPADPEHANLGPLSDAWQLVFVGGAVFTLIAFSFEIDRGVMQMRVDGFIGSWTVGHVRQLMLTLLWGLGAFALGLLALAMRRPDNAGRTLVPSVVLDFAWALLVLCAAKWVFVDVLFAWFDGQPSTPSNGMPIVNLQLLVGLLLAASGLILSAAGNTTMRRAALSLTSWVPVTAGSMILWGLSFEVDRALDRYVDADGPLFFSQWNSNLRLALCITALWSLGGWVMLVLGRARKLWAMIAGGWLFIAISSIAWLTLDTIVPRVGEGLIAATPFLNLQFVVGALLIALLAHATAVLHRAETFAPSIARQTLGQFVPAGLGLIALIVIWLGSLEIDRLLAHEPMSRQTGLSVYWGLSGVVLVVLGFAKRAAMCRYAGLALLTLTVLKVLFVDLAHVDNIARVISFLVSGLLLIATSILYTRLAPRLLASQSE